MTALEPDFIPACWRSLVAMDPETLSHALGWIVVGAPAALLLGLGLPGLLGRRLSEQAIGRMIQTAILTGLAASLTMLAFMAARGVWHVTVPLGYWVSIPHYHFSVKLIFDPLSLCLVVLSFILCGTVGAFAERYMHREPGHARFCLLYALFAVGMVLTSVAGTIETLFAGWEMVGLSSALLVGFYQDRPAPVRNSLWVWVVYRVSDAALLLAAVVMHHLSSEGDFDGLLGAGPWPLGQVSIPPVQGLLVGGLLIVAAAGKSALVPFSGWLPRAMEGPTPSSAIFYGALSVHLGAFLLLRVSPLLDSSVTLSAIVTVLGLATVLVATVIGGVQTDIKSVLSFASLTQVGLIVAEIGLGFRWLPLIHLLGHACLRTLQFLRAPTLLQDYRVLENAMGQSLPRQDGPQPWLVPGSARAWLYRWALHRAYLDAFLAGYIAGPFVRLFSLCDRIERRWTAFLAGSVPSQGESTDAGSTQS